MNTTRRIGVYGAQERARTRASARVRDLKNETDGDDAIPLTRRAAPRHASLRDPPAQPRRGSYRVRDAAARGSGTFAPGFTVDPRESAQNAGRRRQAPPQQHTRRRPSDPDASHNRDEIFLTDSARRERRMEDYRLARRRRALAAAKRFAAVSLLMLLFLVFAGAIVYRFIYRVRDIRVEGSQRYSEEEIVRAAGLDEDVRLYSFSSRTVRDAVTLRCPYIRTLDVSRKAPGTVLLLVEEDTPVFCAELYGELRALSGTLRVLNAVNPGEAESANLIRLRLPPVASAIEGRVLVLSDERYARQFREIATAVAASGLRERITTIDLRRPYSLRMVCDHQYQLNFGSSDDIGVKLRIAQAVLSDSVFQTSIKAQIDLTTTSSTSVVLDDQIDLDE